MAASSDPEALSAAFCELEAIDTVSTSGAAGAKVVTHSGLPVDLRIVPEEAFGNLLQHFTGSGRHNEALRTEAVRRGLHVSEYGISDDESGASEAFATEGGLRAARDGVHPARAAREPRRARGGAQGELPKLIEQATCAATCTCTRRSRRAQLARGDGRQRPASWATSTSRSPTTPPRTGSATTSRRTLRARIEEIRSLADTGILVLAGTETNIMPDGTRLRRRPARGARLGRGQPAHVVPAL